MTFFKSTIRCPGQVPVVGIHVRKGDYDEFLGSFYQLPPVPSDYFTRAMIFFRRKLRVSPLANVVKRCLLHHFLGAFCQEFKQQWLISNAHSWKEISNTLREQSGYRTSLTSRHTVARIMYMRTTQRNTSLFLHFFKEVHTNFNTPIMRTSPPPTSETPIGDFQRVIRNVTQDNTK